MDLTELLTPELVVRWDSKRNALLINHPNEEMFPPPLIEIQAGTLAEMSFEQATQFIGERLVLLIPALRELFVDQTTGRLRETPKV